MPELRFDSRFLQAFPEIATRTEPTPVRSPQILIWSEAAGRELLGLEPPQDPRGIEAQVFGGNRWKDIPGFVGMEPYASRYGGHQFGHWAGQLGDGRAIFLGEAVGPGGRRIEVQLKGAGRTRYSRQGDGRAVLRSSLREFLCSEAMHYLGVPTTRALCCVLTGEPVIRDILYDGHPAPEPGAITTRLAPSFLRVGHFEILAADGNRDLLGRLVDDTIRTHFASLQGDRQAWFEEVCRRTAELMVHWQRVGFVHGVMNTDNLSVLGLTIDYGPYGWMDIYDPDWTPNTTDAEHRRYRFGQQPAIALWNLQRLADALTVLDPDWTPGLESGLQVYATTYNEQILEMMGRKLGLESVPVDLVTELDQALRSVEVDMTFFYRHLAEVRRRLGSRVGQVITRPDAALAVVEPAFYQPIGEATRQRFGAWLKRYLELARADAREAAAVAEEMNRTNPCFVLRNFLVQEALDALARQDRRVMDRLMIALQTPYEENEATRPFLRKLPEWARNRPGCSDLSCSS